MTTWEAMRKGYRMYSFALDDTGLSGYLILPTTGRALTFFTVIH